MNYYYYDHFKATSHEVLFPNLSWILVVLSPGQFVHCQTSTQRQSPWTMSGKNKIKFSYADLGENFSQLTDGSLPIMYSNIIFRRYSNSVASIRLG